MPPKHHAKKGSKPAANKGLTPVKIYLILFNVVSTLLWARLLVLTVWFIATPRSSYGGVRGHEVFGHKATSPSAWGHVAKLADHLSGSYNFHGLGEATKYTQTLAVMEVVHAAIGIVRSPVATVASQVASRLWAVWGVVEMVPKTHTNPLFTTMLLAWSLTETIRYPFYVLSLLNTEWYFLDYLRYTLFLVLYPLGAGSEAFLSFSTLPPLRSLPFVPHAMGELHNLIHALPQNVLQTVIKTGPGRALLWKVAKAKAAIHDPPVHWTPIQVARLVLFFIWWPALYVLYTYMLKQRKKFFAKQKTVGGVNKAR